MTTIDSNDSSISIYVETEYLWGQSAPEEKRFAFAYTITITNNGFESVKLLSRHWLITDGNEQVQEVRGEGVIGEQPTIKPSHSYRYTSGALLETSVGTMQGSYQMISESGQTFDAAIAMFSLIKPGALH